MRRLRYIFSTSSYSSSLDSHKHNRNSCCGNWTVHSVVANGDKDELRFARLGCKRWTCPQCGPKKAKRLRRAIIAAAQGKDLCRLLTLTLDPKSCEAEHSIAYIRDCWNKFRTYLMRYVRKRINFITIVELQRSGYAHLHVLIDRYIEQDWISSAWQAVGGGRIVDVRQVDIHRVAPYLSKYLTKTMLLADFQKGQRRYTTSRGITLFVKAPKGDWALKTIPIERFHQYYVETEALIEQSYDETGAVQWFRSNFPDHSRFQPEASSLHI